VGVWGVLNVTPDSFSDGGRYLSAERAIAHGEALASQGADVLDVGGESSRPPGKTYGAGFARVPVEEEVARVRPVVEALAGAGHAVSIDTVKGVVAQAALEAGARIVNDVSMGSDPALLEATAAHGAELVLMHTRDRGRVDASTTAYGDVVAEVLAELERAVAKAEARGIPRDRIWLDPGIGFAKTPAQSAALLGGIPRLVATGHRVLVGASRKSFIGALTRRGDEPTPTPQQRLGGSLAAVCLAARGGAHAVRVHDVFESRQALRLWSVVEAP
jgi:dihydropteroate synthase